MSCWSRLETLARSALLQPLLRGCWILVLLAGCVLPPSQPQPTRDRPCYFALSLICNSSFSLATNAYH